MKAAIVQDVGDNRVLMLMYQQMFATVPDLKEYRLVTHEGAWKALEWLSKLPEGEKPETRVMDAA